MKKQNLRPATAADTAEAGQKRMYLDMNTLQLLVRVGRMPKDKEAAAAAGRSSRALKKARDLAALHGVEIEKEGPGAYWVTHPDLTDTGNDPCEGNHFCADGQEVLACVQAYADHFTTTKDTK